MIKQQTRIYAVCIFHKLSESTFIIDKKRNSRYCLFEMLRLRGAVLIGMRLTGIHVLSKKLILTLVSSLFQSLFFICLYISFTPVCLSLFRYKYLHCVWGSITRGLGIPHVQSHWQFSSLALLLLFHYSYFLLGMACQGKSQCFPSALYHNAFISHGMAAGYSNTNSFWLIDIILSLTLQT